MAIFTHRSVELPNTEPGPTLAQIIEHRKANGVPEDAHLDYDGCGSHTMSWNWREQMSTEQEVRVREAEAARQAREGMGEF